MYYGEQYQGDPIAPLSHNIWQAMVLWRWSYSLYMQIWQNIFRGHWACDIQSWATNPNCNFQLFVCSRRPCTTINSHQFLCDYWHVQWTLLLFKVLILPASILWFYISLFFFFFRLCVLVVFHLCVWELAWSASDEWAAPDQNSLEVWWPEQTHDKSTMPGHMGLVQPTNNQEPANNQQTTNNQQPKNNDLVQPMMAWANTW